MEKIVQVRSKQLMRFYDFRELKITVFERSPLSRSPIDGALAPLLMTVDYLSNLVVTMVFQALKPVTYSINFSGKISEN